MHAEAGYYEKLVAEGTCGSLKEQYYAGEEMAGHGIWALIRPRTKEEMSAAKRESAEAIKKASRLFIRGQHLLCILCTRTSETTLDWDNLIELRDRMLADPDVPVVVVEGCCMVCDPCIEYDPERNICAHAQLKDDLRDLMVMEKLGIAPGAELPAGEIYRRIYERIDTLKDVCGWGDELNSAPQWRPCGGYKDGCLREAREEGFVTGPPEA